MKADKAEIYDTVVFSTPPRVTEQQLWPKHCVQETWGAELHPQLKVRARVWLSRVVFGCHVLCLAVALISCSCYVFIFSPGNLVVNSSLGSYRVVFTLQCSCVMFQRVQNSIFINKGVNPDIDSYSAFWDNQKLAKTDLCRELEKRHVTDVFICGLAYDICVGKRRENIEKNGPFRLYVYFGSFTQ